MTPGQLESLLHHPPRRGQIAPAMLVHLGDLLPRPRIEIARRRGRAASQSARASSQRAAPLLALGEAEQQPLPERASAGPRRAPSGSRRGSARGRSAPAAGRARPAPPARGRGPGARATASATQPVRAASERMSCRLCSNTRGSSSGPLAPQVLEVDGRDQGAGQIVVAREAERRAARRSPAGSRRGARSRGGARGPAGRRGRRSPGKRRRAENEARLEQRQVEAGPVVGDEAVEAPEASPRGAVSSAGSSSRSRMKNWRTSKSSPSKKPTPTRNA